MKSSTLNNFGFIRIFAALLVVFSHSYALTGNDVPSLFGISAGAYGVYIFFIISGFLLTKTSDFSPRYFWKRGLRVFPGLIVVVLLIVFVLGPLVTNLSIREYFGKTETWSYFIHLGLFVDRLPGVFENNPFPNAVNGSLWMLPDLILMYVVLFFFGNLKLLDKRYLIIVLYIAGLVMLAIQPMILSLIKYIVYINTSITTNSTLISPYHTSSFFSSFKDIFFTIGYMVVSLKFLKFYIVFFGGVLLALYEFDFKINYKILAALLFIVVLGHNIAPSLAIYIIIIVMPCFVIKFALIKNCILNNFGAYGDFSYGIFIYSFPIHEAIEKKSVNNIAKRNIFNGSKFLSI